MQTISQELIVHQFPCLSDNYGFLLHDPMSKQTACIDTPDANAIIQQLNDKDWELTYIFNTHHHHDHIGGNIQLQKLYDCEIYGSQYDEHRIPGITHTLTTGDTVQLGDHQAEIIETPGHTLGHIIYHFSENKILFVGDTLFAMGCGRLFEGSYQQMYESLQTIKAIDKNTTIYCAHEYTLANAEFALSVDTDNPYLKDRHKKTIVARNNNQATVPFKLLDELLTNPFLLADNIDEFSRRRQLKDQF